MYKNKVQFQIGYSLIELFKNYGTESQCIEALFKWRWPAGFYCSHCGSGRYSVIKARKLYQCTDCHHQTSLISGTIFNKPSSRWLARCEAILQAFECIVPGYYKEEDVKLGIHAENRVAEISFFLWSVFQSA